MSKATSYFPIAVTKENPEGTHVDLYCRSNGGRWLVTVTPRHAKPARGGGTRPSWYQYFSTLRAARECFERLLVEHGLQESREEEDDDGPQDDRTTA